MRKILLAAFVGGATIVGLACGGGDTPSTFTPDSAEAGGGDTPDQQPPSLGDRADASQPDGAGSDAAIDCDANPGACLPPAVCGDGKAGLGESCDDGNTTPGDGCSDKCQIEGPYWACAFGSLCVDVRDCAALADAGLDAGCVVPPKAAVCGDKIVDPGEACDDGNVTGGDGCSADCKAIEANYVCPTPGVPCVSTMVCGDGARTGTEQCDDGNKKDGDGCSSACAVEPGWTCLVPNTACTATKCGDGKLAGTEECDDGNNTDNDGCSATCRLQTTTTTTAPTTSKPGSTTVTNWKCPTPGAACVPTTCGDGAREGTEQCDDGNTKPYDGCSPSCTLEPKCPTGKCEAVCGDGLLFDFDANGDGAPDEACDDGNTRDGDGCSATCTVESGYSCTAQVAADPASLDLPAVFRDVKYYKSGDATTHPDFERYGCSAASTGLVETTLDAVTRVPVFKSSTSAATPSCGTQLTSALDFTDWYQDIAINGTQRNKRIDGIQVRLVQQPDGSYLFDSANDDPYKSKGGFLPIDTLGWGDQSNGHNFSFTTELRYWFTYDATKSPQLDFSGDDDVWVFVNGQLALDLGGLHPRLSSSFTIDAAKATALGLVDKRLYEVALFHAERHTTGSNFKLTLRGFVKKRSVCTEVCGDGIRTPSEQCDKGMANTNSGAYGSCRLDCTLGPYCGDKTTTTPPEQCDDGTNLTPWTPTSATTACGPSCMKPAYCGDAMVQGAYGEQCDNGTAMNTGGYGECKSDCSFGPRCGDANVDAPQEECDNGFNLTSYVKHPGATDCAPTCKKPRFCGDGTVDYPFEQCDSGMSNTDGGAYGSCTTDCTLGPHCGDGVKQGPEQCDDGNRVNGDGCSAACLTEGGGVK